jgi:hypothetical protein
MGSGGSRSLLPPGKLFEIDVPGLAPRLTVLQSVSSFVSTLVAFVMDRSITASSQAIKLLEVIWSSLTGN